MPVLPCKLEGNSGFKWGDGGVCFTGDDARERAEAVGRAIHARQARSGQVGKFVEILIEEEVAKLGRDELLAALDVLPEEIEEEESGEVVTFQARLPITKIDEEQRLVFGFASIVEKDGVEVFDLEGDAIAVDEIETAAYEFLEKSRVAGRMHESTGEGHVVESFVLTKEKAEAMRSSGVLKGDFAAAGWWVGFRVTDDEVWEEVKKGDLPMFSIGGAAERVPEEA
jgi:hypothetical protein